MSSSRMKSRRFTNKARKARTGFARPLSVIGGTSVELKHTAPKRQATRRTIRRREQRRRQHANLVSLVNEQQQQLQQLRLQKQHLLEQKEQLEKMQITASLAGDISQTRETPFAVQLHSTWQPRAEQSVAGDSDQHAPPMGITSCDDDFVIQNYSLSSTRSHPSAVIVDSNPGSTIELQCELAHDTVHRVVRCVRGGTRATLYRNIADAFAHHVRASEIVCCTRGSRQLTEETIVGETELISREAIYVHVQDKTRKLTFTKSSSTMGMSLVGNGAGRVMVLRVRKGSLADLAGVTSGMLVTRVNDTAVKSIDTHATVSDRLRGIPLGSAITMTVVTSRVCNYHWMKVNGQWCDQQAGPTDKKPSPNRRRMQLHAIVTAAVGKEGKTEQVHSLVDHIERIFNEQKDMSSWQQFAAYLPKQMRISDSFLEDVYDCMNDELC